MDLIKSSRNATNSIQIDIFVGIWSIFFIFKPGTATKIYYMYMMPLNWAS